MKRFARPHPLFAPVVCTLAFVLACTDATSPDLHAGLTPRNPSLVLGDVPPPPTEAVVVISVASPDVFVGVFTGVYFANGQMLESLAASTELADETLGWNGTAWLRLDNKQTLGSTASANARFQVIRGVTTDPTFSGRGTLVIEGHTITIDKVTFFEANPDCLPAALCATIMFDASVDGVSGHHGTAQAFDRAVCQFVLIPEEGGEGGIFVCPFEGSGS